MCMVGDDHSRYGKAMSDNLAPKPQKEIEDDVLAILDIWSHRHHLTAFLQLSRMLKIAPRDVPAAQARALKAEIAEKAT